MNLLRLGNAIRHAEHDFEIFHAPQRFEREMTEQDLATLIVAATLEREALMNANTPEPEPDAPTLRARAEQVRAWAAVGVDVAANERRIAQLEKAILTTKYPGAAGYIVRLTPSAATAIATHIANLDPEPAAPSHTDCA